MWWMFLFLLWQKCVFSEANDDVTIDFLKDFFEEKNAMITAHFCWPEAYIHKFSRQFISKKQIATFRNTADCRFLSYLANNNYFVLDLNDCESSLCLLKQINKLSLFRFPLKYILLTNKGTFEAISTTLGTHSILPTSEVVVAKRSENYFHLLQPYRVNEENAIIWEDYGNWSASSGLFENLKNVPITQRRYNLRQAKMNVTFFIGNNDTWNHLDNFRFPRIDTFTKQNYGAIKSLLDYINVSANYIGTDSYGYYNETTKQWSGLIRDLHQGRTQLAGSSPFLTNQRAKVADFIKMQNPLEIRFLLKKPALSYMTNIFYLAFRASVWICISAVVVLFAVALYVILNWETSYKKLKFKNRFTTSDIALILFEAVCQQGTTTEPNSVSGRTIAVILFMAFMFLYVSYSANIVVLLQSTTQIKTLKELLESRIEAGGYDTSYMRVYLSDAKDDIRKTLYARKIGPDGYYTLDEGMARVQSGFFAFHVELGAAYNYVLEKFTDYEICGLQELEGYTQYFKGYTCIPKNSPYKEIFKVGLYKIDEYGIQKRNNRRYFITPKCYSKGGNFDSVGFVDCYHIVLIWLCGVFVALMIFAIEKCLHRMKLNGNFNHEQLQLRYEFVN